MIQTKEELLKQNHQTENYDKMLDKYRDNNWMPVYRCTVCGVRGIGSLVTLHDITHGPMVREEIKQEIN